jgi:hypothetical protein
VDHVAVVGVSRNLDAASLLEEVDWVICDDDVVVVEVAPTVVLLTVVCRDWTVMDGGHVVWVPLVDRVD